MKKIYISLFLFSLSLSLLAQQGSLRGKIVEQGSNQPVNGALVVIRSTSLGDVSDQEGNYSIDNIDPGSYTLEVSFLGYETLQKEVSITENQQTILDVFLEESIYALQEVEVVGRTLTEYTPDVTYAGTRTGASVKLVPQSIAILNKEILVDQQIFRVDEISDNVAGITLFSPGRFTSRGFDTRQNYINGNRAIVSLDFSASSVTSHYERIEVVKGPAAALFGNSSPGGIINSVTKKPLATNRASASFTVGSFSTMRATTDITGPLNEDKTLLYRLNVVWEDAETYRDFQINRNLLVAPSLTYLPDDKTSINIDLVSAQANDQAGVDRGMPVLQGDLFALPISFSSAEPYDYRQNTNTLLTISANRKFTDFLSINASYSRSDFDQNFLETRSANVFTDDGTELIRSILDRNTTAASNFLATYLVAKFNTGDHIRHEAVAGFDYFENDQQTTTKNAATDVNGVPNLRFTNRIEFDNLDQLQLTFNPVPQSFTVENSYRGYYLQDLMKIGNRLNVLLGLRYEELDQDGLVGNDVDLTNNVDNTVFLPRLGITYELTPQVNLFASYSESFDLQAVPNGVNVVEPGTDFDPLASEQIEFGSKTSFFNNRLLAQVSIYQIWQSGRLIEDPQAAAGLVQLIQLGEEESRGVELDVTGSVSPDLSLTVNYAFNEVEILDASEEVEQLSLENNNPQHTVGFWGKYTITSGILDNFSFGLGGRYVSESQTVDPAENLIENVITFPSYFTAKAAIFYKYKDLGLALNVNNIFDERYFFGGFNAGRVFPGAPRNYLATVSYSF